MAQKYGEAHIDRHFPFLRHHLRGDAGSPGRPGEAVAGALDLLLVIGGYNSSNTSHLAEMGEAKLPTYFIKNAAKMRSDKLILHYDQHKHEEIETATGCPRARSPSASPPAPPVRTT
jgi:4-hydroxy-3-methylbut-2-enyl diphosphate reductase